MTNETNFKKFKAKFTEPLAIIGVIAVVLFGIWISIQGIKAVPSVGEYMSQTVWPRLNAALISVTSIFIPAEKITTTLDITNTLSETPVVLSWNHTSKRGDGVYTFYYPCLKDFTFKTTGELLVQCDKELDIKSEQTVHLIPFLTTGETDVPISITYTKENGERVTGQTTLHVASKVVSTPPSPVTHTSTPASTPKPTKPVVSFTEFETNPGPTTPGKTSESTYTLTSPKPSTPVNAQPDLTVKVLAVGTIDPSTNVFTVKSEVSTGERAAIKFEIINIGTKKADGWTFNAVLPTFPSHIFHSDTQLPLTPGDKIEFTLGFDQIDVSQNTAVITIYADPTNSINESNKENNLAQAKLTIKK
jgi:hypothetical protein